MCCEEAVISCLLSADATFAQCVKIGHLVKQPICNMISRTRGLRPPHQEDCRLIQRNYRARKRRRTMAKRRHLR